LDSKRRGAMPAVMRWLDRQARFQVLVHIRTAQRIAVHCTCCPTEGRHGRSANFCEDAVQLRWPGATCSAGSCLRPRRLGAIVKPQSAKPAQAHERLSQGWTGVASMARWLHEVNRVALRLRSCSFSYSGPHFAVGHAPVEARHTRPTKRAVGQAGPVAGLQVDVCPISSQGHMAKQLSQSRQPSLSKQRGNCFRRTVTAR